MFALKLDAFCGSFPGCPAKPAAFADVTNEHGAGQQKNLMTILLQNKKTLRYVEGHTRWTTHAEHAQEFGTGLEAICFCLTHDIIDMQILGRFADARMDFSVAVTDLRGS